MLDTVLELIDKKGGGGGGLEVSRLPSSHPPPSKTTPFLVLLFQISFSMRIHRSSLALAILAFQSVSAISGSAKAGGSVESDNKLANANTNVDVSPFLSFLSPQTSFQDGS